MSKRIIDPQTIRRMSPLLAQIAADLADAYADACDIHQADAAALSEAMDAVLARVQGYTNEIEQLGGSVRSYHPVQIEFLAEVGPQLGTIRWSPDGDEPFRPAEALCAEAVAA